ncbi:AAA family ATPase [Castellaniella sp.]|uniref:AAA family ATPase n=1 Tax=Castellaniella sp. TaxID=1955812 RepID=UPI00355FED02
MRLTQIRLEQWRQFKAPFALHDLQPGINIIAGPNESGKSTLVEAIRAAFFERHKSGTVTHFQPWGDTAAEPAVSLTFQWQNQTWQLDKRFLGHARCSLVVDGTRFNGDDAEDRLTELMGYSLAGRGASKPEHQGIPGLLWVQQGRIQDVRQAVEYAAAHLQIALGQDLGAMASSSGDWLLAEVRAQRAELLTPTGRPTGSYKSIETRLGDRKAQLLLVSEQVRAYEDKVDALARLQAQREQIDAARPWVAQREQAEKASARLKEVEQLQAQLEQTQRELAHCTSQQALLREQLQGFGSDAALLAERAAALARTHEALDALNLRRADVETRQHQAKVACDTAENTFQQARRHARHLRLQAEYAQLETWLDKHGKTLHTLQQLQQDLRALSTQRQQQAVDTATLAKLRQLQKALDHITLRKQVAATRIRWQLQAGQALAIGDQAITGSGEQLLLQSTSIDIPGVGQLQIAPGGKDAAELAREDARLSGDRASLLADLGVQDLAEAEARAADCQRLEADIMRARTRIQDLAPEGVDAFMQQCEDGRHRLAELAELAGHIAGSPGAQGDLPDEEEAERTRNAANEALKAADTALQKHLESLGLAQQAFDTSKTEWARLDSKLKDPAYQKNQQNASQALTEQKARQDSLQARIRQYQAEIDSAQPQVLKDDVTRFRRSADALEDAAHQRQRDIDRLQTELDTLGAQGLEEKRGELQQAVDTLQRHLAQLTARANALDLLFTLLQEARQTLTRQLQAPLQKHLAHYLRLLFPAAEIQVDDNLVPTLLQRGSQYSTFDDLSYGAREQLGLISRLAYADLLQEAGRPTLIILDDALVHSDAERLAQMKRMLYDAAKRHQVLLFSCHPENWNDLGVPALDLPSLKARA